MITGNKDYEVNPIIQKNVSEIDREKFRLKLDVSLIL